MMTLESSSRSRGIGKVDVLKLDVEGHEMDVLRGAGTLLESIERSVRIRRLQHRLKNVLQDFWYLLSESGFKIYRLGPSGLSALSNYSERDEVFVTPITSQAVVSSQEELQPSSPATALLESWSREHPPRALPDRS